MTCDAMWILASAQSTSEPFIQILPVPGKAINYSFTEDTRGGLTKAGTMLNLQILTYWYARRTANSRWSDHCCSLQNGQRSVRACSGLRQCQQKRAAGASRARSRLWMLCASSRPPRAGVPATLETAPGCGVRVAFRAVSTSSSRSDARWYLAVVSGASAFMTMSLIDLGIDGFFSRGGDTSSPDMSLSRSAGAGMSYGRTPVSI